jgi:PAS domain S-box-containing protein
MENVEVLTEVLYEEVSQLEKVLSQLDINQAELLRRYNQIFKETLFENRSQIRPAMLPGTAASEVEALIGYFQHLSPEMAIQRGAELCRKGFSEKTLLRLGVVSRQFFLEYLESELFPVALSMIDAYQMALLQGFVQTRGDTIFNEQAQIRSALLKSLSRYTTQMELAAGVGLAINSIFNLDDLLNTTVKLICDHFDLFYVGVFLKVNDSRCLTLSAGFGVEQEKQTVLLSDYHFEVGDPSLIGQCMVDGKPKIALDMTTQIIGIRWRLHGSRSAIAIPLMARGKAIGALVCYSQHSSAFSDQDAAALRIMGDQLANAIENSHLFSEVQLSEKKYRTILDTIEEGYYEMDLNGHFTFANDAACAILGYPPAETINVNYRQFIVPEQMDKLEEAFEWVRLTGNAAQGVEHGVIRKDGAARTVEIYISLTQNLAGQVVGFRGILRDITRRKEVEQYLIERRALERSNQELEQFAYIASHDLQEPLRKIQAFGDRLKTISAATLNADGLDSLERMMKSAHRMSVLISDLLNLSRIKTQTQPFVPVDLNQVLQEVLSDLDSLIERTGGSVEAENMPTIKADPLQMRQLLQNLIGNALKFHKPDEPPVIKISTQTMEEGRTLRDLGGNDVCRVTVQDNGIGFDEKYLERIFQPFQRLHTSKEYEGTGIGLSVCRSIVERHHGQLTAQSINGQGAAFVITLPIQDNQDKGNHE